MSRLFQKSFSVDHCVAVSAPEEEDVKKRKENKGLISKKLDKKDKKDKKEKETRYPGTVPALVSIAEELFNLISKILLNYNIIDDDN